MKTLIICMLTVLLGRGCDGETLNELKTATIEYEAYSRGYYLNINIQDSKLFIKDKRDEVAREYKLSESEWKQLASSFKTIKLRELKDYKGPTQKRFYDGAAIATLEVVYDGETYATEAFDHLGPPAEIADFVNKLVSYANQRNDN